MSVTWIMWLAAATYAPNKHKHILLHFRFLDVSNSIAYSLETLWILSQTHRHTHTHTPCNVCEALIAYSTLHTILMLNGPGPTGLPIRRMCSSCRQPGPMSEFGISNRPWECVQNCLRINAYHITSDRTRVHVQCLCAAENLFECYTRTASQHRISNMILYLMWANSRLVLKDCGSRISNERSDEMKRCSEMKRTLTHTAHWARTKMASKR